MGGLNVVNGFFQISNDDYRFNYGAINLNSLAVRSHFLSSKLGSDV
jgi:hypothetical protein